MPKKKITGQDEDDDEVDLNDPNDAAGDDEYKDHLEEDDAENQQIREKTVGNQIGQKRKAEQSLVDKRKLKRRNREKFINYYSGTFYSKSTAMNFYELSKQLNRNNKDLLWFWIIGMSNLIVHHRIGEMEYNEEVRMCNEEVLRMHPSASN